MLHRVVAGGIPESTGRPHFARGLATPLHITPAVTPAPAPPIGAALRRALASGLTIRQA